MDGLILHLDTDQGNGLVRAGDGKRYSFTIVDWKSSGTPSVGDVIDFEIDGDSATEIYLVRPGTIVASPIASPVPERSVAAAPSPGEMGSYLAQRPGLIFAGCMLASCFLPFISVSVVSVSLFGVVRYVSFALDLLSATPGSPAGAKAALWCFYLLYGIPIAAGWLIYREIRGEADTALRMKVGAVGLAGPLAIVALSAMFALASMGGQSYGQMPSSTIYPMSAPSYAGGLAPSSGPSIFSFIGIGWYLLAASGAALIAVGCGWSPFRASAERDPAYGGDTDAAAGPSEDAALVGSHDADQSIDPPHLSFRQILIGRQALPFALLLFIACLLPMISDGGISSSIWSLPAYLENGLYAGDQATASITFIIWFYRLLYVVPLLAGYLIFREIREEASTELRAGVGIIGLAGPFAILALGALIAAVSLPQGQLLTFWYLVSSMSFGWALIIASSISIACVAAGWRPFGESEPEAWETRDEDA